MAFAMSWKSQKVYVKLLDSPDGIEPQGNDEKLQIEKAMVEVGCWC